MAKKRGRPRSQEKREAVTAYLPAPLAAKAREKAMDQGITVSSWAGRILVSALS